MNPTFSQISKLGLQIFVFLAALACTTVNATAASLFGDLSCQTWADLDHSRKKTWTNAFLAPLSLTHQGLERTKQGRYNDDPKAFESAIVSIDTFCHSHPKLGPADGAISYLNELIENQLGQLAQRDSLLTIQEICKAVARDMVMTDGRVREKRGGKSGSQSGE